MASRELSSIKIRYMTEEIKHQDTQPALVAKIWRGGLKPQERVAAMLQVDEVVKALTPSERAVIKATAGKRFDNYPESEQAFNFSAIVQVISKDLGCKIENDDNFKIKAVRMLEYMQKYFYTTTFEELKLAFELLNVGELDQYLPKNQNGEPNRNHYQDFNAEFLARVLNAYKQRANAVQVKAQRAMPLPVSVITERQNARNWDNIKIRCIKDYFYFLQCDRVSLSVRAANVVRWLNELGVNPEYTATDEDKEVAELRLKDDIKTGKINKWDAVVGGDVFFTDILERIVLQKVIEKSFQELKEKNADVLNLTKFETCYIKDGKIFSKY